MDGSNECLVWKGGRGRQGAHTGEHRACRCRMKKENGRLSGESCIEVMAACGCCCRCCCSGSSSSFVVIVIVLSLCGSRRFVLFEPPSSWTVSFYVDKECRCTNKRRRRRPSPPRTTATTTTTMSVFAVSIVWLFVESGRVVAIVICASMSLMNCIR